MVGGGRKEELLRNGFREEIGLPMTDTGPQKAVVEQTVKVAKNRGLAMERATGE